MIYDYGARYARALVKRTADSAGVLERILATLERIETLLGK